MLETTLEACMQHEASLIGQVQDHLATFIPTRYIPVPDPEPKARPLVFNAETYEGKKEKISFFGLDKWIWL